MTVFPGDVFGFESSWVLSCGGNWPLSLMTVEGGLVGLFQASVHSLAKSFINCLNLMKKKPVWKMLTWRDTLNHCFSSFSRTEKPYEADDNCRNNCEFFPSKTHSWRRCFPAVSINSHVTFPVYAWEYWVGHRTIWGDRRKRGRSCGRADEVTIFY